MVNVKHLIMIEEEASKPPGEGTSIGRRLPYVDSIKVGFDHVDKVQGLTKGGKTTNFERRVDNSLQFPPRHTVVAINNIKDHDFDNANKLLLIAHSARELLPHK